VPASLVSPGFIIPMMPTLVDEPPTTEGWIHEIKHDGYRTILAVEGAPQPAPSRDDWTKRYLPIVASAAQLGCWSAIIDGEMVVQDPHGCADFHAMGGPLKGARAPGLLRLRALARPIGVLWPFADRQVSGETLEEAAVRRSAPAGASHDAQALEVAPSVGGEIPSIEPIGCEARARAASCGRETLEALVQGLVPL
jgi:hypothetical protein